MVKPESWGKPDGKPDFVFKVCGNYFSSRMRRPTLVSHLPRCPTSVNTGESAFPAQWAAGEQGSGIRCCVSSASTTASGTEQRLRMFEEARGSDLLDSHGVPQEGHCKGSLTTSLESYGEDLFPSPTPLQSKTYAHPREERTAHLLPFQAHSSLPCWHF